MTAARIANATTAIANMMYFCAIECRFECYLSLILFILYIVKVINISCDKYINIYKIVA